MTDLHLLSEKTANNKNILIFPHYAFDYQNGGVVVQYYLAKILDELGVMVRMHPHLGTENNCIFNKFYDNEFPLDENSVVIYCEGILGNPLNAPNVVRWMLSVLGQNVPHSCADTWGKNELVYHFNSEQKFSLYPEKKHIYKMLSNVYVDPEIKQINFEKREGSCFTFRKAFVIHRDGFFLIHPQDSFEIIGGTQQQCIEFFNKYKYFYSYDSNTFLTIMAALCGCISIVYKVNGLSKSDWIKKTPASEYLLKNNMDNLYGIAYGEEDIPFAEATLYLVKEQWDEILKFNIENTIIPFINDIQDFEYMENNVYHNFFED